MVHVRRCVISVCKRYWFWVVPLLLCLFIVWSKSAVMVTKTMNNVSTGLTEGLRGLQGPQRPPKVQGFTQIKPFPVRTISAGESTFSSGQSWLASCDNKSASPLPVEVHHMKSRDLMYCSLPKVGCTFWKRIFRYMNGDMKKLAASNPFEMSKNDVHHNVGIRFTPTTTKNSKAYRFMFVREPFSRLWSGYVDKLVLPNFWNLLGKDIVMKTRNLTSSEQTCGSDVSFEELLRYIVTTKHKIEPHFAPMYTLCNPCSFKPHFVGKLETFGSDSSFIANRFNLTSLFKLFKGRGIQEMIDQIKFAFMFIRREHITCVSEFELTQKLWKAFQYVGYIPSYLPFPKKKVADLERITDSAVSSLFFRELEQTKFSKEEGRQQKQKYLHEELNKLPLSVRRNILKIYHNDFEMFSYDKSYYFSQL